MLKPGNVDAVIKIKIQYQVYEPHASGYLALLAYFGDTLPDAFP